MNVNPYEAPATAPQPVVGLLSNNILELRRVAQAQRGLLMCILVQIIVVIAQAVTPQAARPLWGLVLLPLAIASTAFTFMLAVRVYGMAAGIILGIVALIPCFGLIVLLVVNQKAVTVLKENGIRVGLMGARMADFARFEQQPPAGGPGAESPFQ